jgi:iron(III) transport system permease protein
LATFLAFFISRTALPLRALTDTIVTIPAAVPGSLFGLAFVLAFNGKIPLFPGLRLTGSGVIIIIAMLVCELPAAYKIISSAMSRLRVTLDDSAQSLGASKLVFLRTIAAPLCSGGIVSAFVYCFIRASGTVSAVIFLISFNTKLTSVSILNLASQGNWGASAALALILTLILFVSMAILRLSGGKQIFHDMFNR